MIPELSHESIERFTPTGSRFICNPPPTGTDNDHVVLATRVRTAIKHFKATGFDCHSGLSAAIDEGNSHDAFWSLRRGDINLIVTGDSDFYERFVLATKLARRFNLLLKADRVALFQAILYGRDHLIGILNSDPDQLMAVRGLVGAGGDGIDSTITTTIGSDQLSQTEALQGGAHLALKRSLESLPLHSHFRHQNFLHQVVRRKTRVGGDVRAYNVQMGEEVDLPGDILVTPTIRIA